MLPLRCAHVALNVAIEHPLADLLADLCGRWITCASVLRWRSMLRGSRAQVRSIGVARSYALSPSSALHAARVASRWDLLALPIEPCSRGMALGEPPLGRRSNVFDHFSPKYPDPSMPLMGPVKVVV
jgi:hypothetical protein